MPPDALKMHSLAVPVLRFLCKTFSKLRELNKETLFSVDVWKKSWNKKLKKLFWAPEFGRPNRYTGLPNGLDTSLAYISILKPFNNVLHAKMVLKTYLKYFAFFTESCIYLCVCVCVCVCVFYDGKEITVSTN